MFDCDGVLVDSEPISYLAWAAAIARYGHHLTPAEFAVTVGTTDERVAIDWAPQLGCDPVELHEAANEEFRLRCSDAELFPDSLALRESLTVPSAVGTNSQRWRLDLILSATGLDSLFAHTVSVDDVERPKPAPDIYLEAFSLIGVDPTDGLVIEDSPAGIAAARATGAFVVAVDRGELDAVELQGASVVVPTLAP